MSESTVSHNGCSMPTVNGNPAKFWHYAGLLATPVRWTIGWLFFSAFLRRMINEPSKMNPEAAGYVGEKFNHFFPHAIWGQKELIEYLLHNPSAMQIFLIVFTILEGLCGLGLITGTLTRLSAFGIALMSYGVLTGSGWIGATCLDEWQIGVLGITGSLVVMVAGAPRWSIDTYLNKVFPRKFLPFLTSGPLFTSSCCARKFTRVYLTASAIAVIIMLSTYQIFFNGLWGKLHNHSVRPEVELSQANISSDGNTLNFHIFRTGGPDTYGAFIVKGEILAEDGSVLHTISTEDLAAIPADNIENKYLVKIRPAANSLVVPLGGYAEIRMPVNATISLADTKANLRLEDVSGIRWETQIK